MNWDILFSRCALIEWQLDHPWTLLLGPALIGLFFLITKIRNR